MRTTSDVELIDVTTSGTGWSRRAFLHFGIIHLAFNMFLLFQLGQLLEPALGRVRFALLYFASMLGGSAGVLICQPNGLTVGPPAPCSACSARPP